MLIIVDVIRIHAEKVFGEVQADHIHIVLVTQSVVFARKDHHVEVFSCPDQGPGKTEGAGRMDIVVHISGDEQKPAFQVRGEFCSDRHVAPENDGTVLRRFSLQSLIGFTPPLHVDIVVVVSRGSHSDLVEIRPGEAATPTL